MYEIMMELDNKLKFDKHINETVNKSNKLVGMITHIIQTSDLMESLFKTLIRPVLEHVQMSVARTSRSMSYLLKTYREDSLRVRLRGLLV